jgi:hypothetical protein
MLALAVLGALIAGIQRPFKQPRVLAHAWTFIWFICLILYTLSLDAYGAYQNRPVLAVLTSTGAVGTAICAAYGLTLIARRASGARSASNVILCITTGLVTAALVLLAISFGQETIKVLRITGVVLFAASFASLLESAVVLTGRRRSRKLHRQGAIARS